MKEFILITLLLIHTSFAFASPFVAKDCQDMSEFQLYQKVQLEYKMAKESDHKNTIKLAIEATGTALSVLTARVFDKELMLTESEFEGLQKKIAASQQNLANKHFQNTSYYQKLKVQLHEALSELKNNPKKYSEKIKNLKLHKRVAQGMTAAGAVAIGYTLIDLINSDVSWKQKFSSLAENIKDNLSMIPEGSAQSLATVYATNPQMMLNASEDMVCGALKTDDTDILKLQITTLATLLKNEQQQVTAADVRPHFISANAAAVGLFESTNPTSNKSQIDSSTKGQK